MKQLNQQQQQAVLHTEGPLLILAGAGSGKTQVITSRITHLIRDKRIPSEQILAVTFTNKAAREMKERVLSMAGEQAKETVISTFHSLAVRMLRRDIRALGFNTNFSIYSPSDQMGILRQAMRDKDIDPKRCDPDGILWRISAAKNRLISPRDYSPDLNNPLDCATAQVYPRYQQLLKAFNAVDFDDLIMCAVTLLQTVPAITQYWQTRFRYIMVDEYQDTNASQYLFISLLAHQHGNICVVGDDDQSIYGWRGAEVENILNFDHQHPGCQVIKLEQNYRSTGTILQAANQVIRNNTKRSDKALWTSMGSGAPIDYYTAETEEAEATQVVEQILLQQYHHKLMWSDMAILYRSNAQSRAFEERLRMERVPHVIIGGTRFYERKEVKDSIAYLRVIDNPHDEASLLRIINFPRRGIGDTTLLRLNQWSQEHNLPLFDALKRVDTIDGIPETAKKAVHAFYQLLTGIIADFNPRSRLGAQVNQLFNRLRIEDELYRTLNDSSQAKKRIENIEQVVNSLALFEEQNPRATLGAFLERISLMDEDQGDTKEGSKDNAVTLMSLHSSKGLEFSNVWLVGMEEGLLPHKRSAEEDPTVAEERRLCYVGITRARKQLTVSHCLSRKRYGVTEECLPSRFLAEIPPELLREAGQTPEPDEKKSAALAADFFSQMLGG